MPKSELKIFEYDSYREFLRDFFKMQKIRKQCFSQRYFARKAGFSSHSFCVYLIKGERNLSAHSVDKLIAALGLDGKAADYFRALVKYTQAATIREKDDYFKEMNLIRKNTSFYKLHQKHYQYFDEWYYPVVRELAVLKSWGGDFGGLGRSVVPPISALEAKKALATLLAMGLLTKSRDGSFKQNASAVTVDGFPSHLIRKARNSYIRLAIDASDTLGPNVRNISAATVALSTGTFKTVSAEIDTLRDRIVALAADEKESDTVFQFNVQFFPVSAPINRQDVPGAASKPKNIRERLS